MQIRENVTSISEFGPILPIIQTLQVSAFNYKKVVNSPAQEEYIDELTGQVFPAQEETYIPFPEGIQVMIEPSSLESMYPEGVVTNSDGTKYYRADLVTAFLVQAVKELADKVKALESK